LSTICSDHFLTCLQVVMLLPLENQFFFFLWPKLNLCSFCRLFTFAMFKSKCQNVVTSIQVFPDDKHFYIFLHYSFFRVYPRPLSSSIHSIFAHNQPFSIFFKVRFCLFFEEKETFFYLFSFTEREIAITSNLKSELKYNRKMTITLFHLRCSSNNVKIFETLRYWDTTVACAFLLLSHLLSFPFLFHFIWDVQKTFLTLAEVLKSLFEKSKTFWLSFIELVTFNLTEFITEALHLSFH